MNADFIPFKNSFVKKLKILYNFGNNCEKNFSLNDKKNIDLFILAGQSNASGYTPIDGLYKPYTYGGTLDETKLKEYQTGYKNVIYFGAPEIADLSNIIIDWQTVKSGLGATKERIGPELGFAEIINGYYGNGKLAGVVKYGKGGSGFTNAVREGGVTDVYGNWTSPSLKAKKIADGVKLIPRAGQLYDNLVLAVKLAVQNLKANGYAPSIKCVLWFQGCQEACVKEDAPRYKEYITYLIEDLRADLSNIMRENLSSLPFIICKIGENLKSPDALYWRTVREQMQLTAKSVNGIRIIETLGMTLPDINDNNDVWHFSAKDMLEIGKRFGFTALQELGFIKKVYHTVTFKLNDTVFTKKVLDGLSVERPSELVAWVDDNGKEWDFDFNAVLCDLTLSAK